MRAMRSTSPASGPAWMGNCSKSSRTRNALIAMRFTPPLATVCSRHRPSPRPDLRLRVR
jgi:hypothetical protein